MSAYNLLLFFFMFSVSSYAKEEIIKEEANSYKTSIQEKHLEANLLESPQYKECREQFKDHEITTQASQIKTCFNEKMENVSDADLKKFAEQTNITQINAEQTKTAKGIREYLSEKIARAIQGKNYDPKTHLNKQKYVNQIQYFDLYAEQLGKNVILETTNYCLEGIRFIHTPNENTFFLSSPCETLMQGENLKDPLKIHACLKTIIEINYPQREENVENETYFSTPKSLQEISKAELQKSPDYLQRKALFCGQIISKMCDNFKCGQDQNAVACLKTKEDEELSYSRPATPADASPSLFSKQKENGIKACNVLNRLRSYRKTLADVEKIKEELIKNGGNGGYHINVAFADEYQPGKDDSYSEITTVSSRELTENEDIDDLYGLKDKAEKLRDKCENLDEKAFLADKDCAALVDLDIEKKEVALEASFHAETKIRETELDKLKDKEEIKKYLERIGFSNLYDDGLETEELKKLISSHYTNEREALIKSMRERLEKRMVKKESQAGDIQKAANIAITDLENEKDRLGTILHYNNVISSFLTTEDESTKERSTNIVSLQREMEDYDKFKKKDDDQTASEYFKNAYEGRESASNKASGLNYMDYLDQLIGNSK